MKIIKKRIDQSMFGQHWPFNVSSGILVIDQDQSIYFKHMLKKYGINHHARLSGGINPDPIWKNNQILTHKMPMSPIINYAIDMYQKHLKEMHE